MKKRIALLAAIAAAGGGAYAYRDWFFRTGTVPGTTVVETAPVRRGPLSAHVAGTGVVEARTVIEVKSRASGKVVQFDANEGDDVQIHRVLVELDGTEEKRSLDVAEAAVAVAETEVVRARAALASLEIDVRIEDARVAQAAAQLARAKIALDLWRLEHPAAVATLEAQLAAARTELAVADSDLERQRKLGQVVAKAELEATQATREMKAAAATKVEMDLRVARDSFALRSADREQEISQLGHALAAAQASLARMRGEAGSIGGSPSELAAKAQLAAAESKRTSAEVERARAKERVDQTQIESDIDGVLVRKLVERGQIIASGVSSASGGTPLAQVADLDTLFVVCDVDESDIGRVRVGQRARIMVDAHPAHTFSGRVSAIAPQGVSQSNVVVFRVRILVLSLRRRMLEEFVGHGGQEPPRRPSTDEWTDALELDQTQRARLRDAFVSHEARRKAILAVRPEEDAAAARRRRRDEFPAARKALDATIREILGPGQFARYDEQLLRIGMSAAVEIEVASVRDALVLPAAALRTEQGVRGVYVKSEAGAAAFRPIGAVLLENSDAFAIAPDGAGIAEGDLVVVRGLPAASGGGSGSNARGGRSGGGGGGWMPTGRR